MRAAAIGLFLGAVLFASSASAYDPYDPANCNGGAEWDDKGAEWGDKRVLVVSKVTAKPRVNFVKSPYDDDFKAEICPAATDACRKSAYLVTGDLVLTGRTHGEFTCVSYHSPLSNKRIWATGWLPSVALTPVAPMQSPKVSDWVGNWRQGSYVGGGLVEIKAEGHGKLHIEAGILVPTARDFHNGVFEAHVTPQGDTLAFEDDANNYGSGCQVRMQRIGPWLLIEDNGGCGGAAVTFTGLYRRTK
ncbi:MAG TPA: hypothetical protein VEH78_06480 [Pseudolabrys sp.]|nr:hypothetical protein [Pseudolabrys sp.]